MARVVFTPNLTRHIDAPEAAVDGASVRAVLDAYFEAHPKVRGYVLDDQGALRQHMVIFVNGEQIHDRSTLADAIEPSAELYVMQALSGG